jgi:hypothetical protein
MKVLKLKNVPNRQNTEIIDSIINPCVAARKKLEGKFRRCRNVVKTRLKRTHEKKVSKKGKSCGLNSLSGKFFPKIGHRVTRLAELFALRPMGDCLLWQFSEASSKQL